MVSYYGLSVVLYALGLAAAKNCSIILNNKYSFVSKKKFQSIILSNTRALLVNTSFYHIKQPSLVKISFYHLSTRHRLAVKNIILSY